MQGLRISGNRMRLKSLFIEILSWSLVLTYLVKFSSNWYTSSKQTYSSGRDPPFGKKNARSINGCKCSTSQVKLSGSLFLIFLMTSCLIVNAENDFLLILMDVFYSSATHEEWLEKLYSYDDLYVAISASFMIIRAL